MDIEYQAYVSLEKCEKEALQLLAEIYNQCLCDDRLSCDYCPFKPEADCACIPFLCHNLWEEMK